MAADNAGQIEVEVSSVGGRLRVEAAQQAVRCVSDQLELEIGPALGIAGRVQFDGWRLTMRSGRRRFLAGAAALGLAPRIGWAAAGGADVSGGGGPAGRGDSSCSGWARTGDERFRLPLPARGHAAAAHPVRAEAVAFARRPGAYALVLDCLAGAVRLRLDAPEGRAFQGHGAFSPDGAVLFTTEVAEEGRGVIGLWDASAGYARIGETPSGGDGPHEMLLMPDRHAARGGQWRDPDGPVLRARAAEPRRDAAEPRLSRRGDRARSLEVLEMPEALRFNSLRHLAAGPDGTVAAALQWAGAQIETPPLLALHRPGAAALEFRVGARGAAAADAQLRGLGGDLGRRPARGDHRAEGRD